MDLVFPQNDTYAPEPIIPVAFAFQHSELAGYLQPSIAFSISPYGNNSESIAGGYYDQTWTNFTSSDPYMQYGEGLEVLNTEGTWMLEWTLSITNYSSSGNLEFSRDSKRRRTVFTKNGAKKPDLTAATGEDTCSNAQGYVFKITETQDSGDHLDNGKPCAVLAETTPTPSPCGVKIEASAASSVSASLTDKACAVETASWCPEPDDEGAAQSLVIPSLAVGGIAFLAAALSGLGFLVI